MDQLGPVVTALVALSIATERLVDIVKSVIPRLDQKKDDPVAEGRRKAGLQVLAGIAGVATAFLAQPALNTAIPTAWQSPTAIFVLGLFASGGSGFWNSIQNFTLNAKDVKKIEAQQMAGQSPLMPGTVLGPITRT